MTSSSTSPDQRDHVLVLCHMLSNRISRSFSRELDKAGITIAEWRVLLELTLQPGVSGQEISRRWAMDKMAISRAVSSLENRGWISRRQSVQDKRSLNLELTPAGQEAYERILPAANRHYHRLVEELDRSELASFRDTLLNVIGQADRALS